MTTTFPASVSIDGDAAAGTMKISITQTAEQPVPPNPPSGAWEPPSWLRFDKDVVAMSTASKPGYLARWQDPVFKTWIIRICDDPGKVIKNIAGATWGDVAGHHYSSDQAWNCDQTLLYLDKNNGSGASALCLNGETYEPLFKVSGLPTDVRWHNSEPALMNYVSGSILGTFNPKTGAKQTIIDFGSQYASLTFGGYEGSFSEDGEMVVVMCQYAGQTTGFAYNVKTKEKGKNIWASEVSSGTCDNVRISSDGKYILWGFDPDLLIITDLVGTKITTLPEDYISHFDVITDQAGDACVCGRLNADMGGEKSGRIAKYRLRDGMRTMLSTGGWSYHTSTRAMKRRRWAVSGAGDEGGSYPPYNGEILMHELAGGKTYRLGHSHVPRAVDYKAETQASHSPDGSRVVFRTAWNGTGSAPRPVQDYVIDMRG